MCRELFEVENARLVSLRKPCAIYLDTQAAQRHIGQSGRLSESFSQLPVEVPDEQRVAHLVQPLNIANPYAHNAARAFSVMFAAINGRHGSLHIDQALEHSDQRLHKLGECRKSMYVEIAARNQACLRFVKVEQTGRLDRAIGPFIFRVESQLLMKIARLAPTCFDFAQSQPVIAVQRVNKIIASLVTRE
eukprot:1068362-Prymnesium_polylepis.1